MRYAFRFGILLAVFAAPIDFCPAAPPVDEATHAAKIIVQLNDVDPALRRQASLQLNSLGAEALPVVEKVAASGENRSPEQRIRLKKALTILRPRARDMNIRSARRDWLRRIFVDAYNAGGHTNAKWDAAAIAAIDTYLTSSLNRSGNSQPLVIKTFEACKAATDLGCDDPIIYVLYRIHAPGDMLVEHTDNIMFWGRVRGDLKEAKYPAVLLLWLDVDSLRMKPSIAMVASMDWSRRFEQIVKAGTTAPEHADFLGRRMYRALNVETDLAGHSAKAFIAEYKRISGKTVGTLLCDSDELFKEMGRDLYRQMQNFPQTWQSEGKLLAAAEKLCIEAEALNPLDPRPAVELVRIKFHEFDAKSEEFEKAFEHAAALNPDDLFLYEMKADYLSPEWRGDDKAMLAFGRECLETENWRGGIPMTLIKIHEHLAGKTADADAYFTERGVREDINEVFLPHLLNFPDDVNARCNYAKYAMRCEDWAAAKTQFDIIGDGFDGSVFPSKELYEHDRDKAARLALRASKP